MCNIIKSVRIMIAAMNFLRPPFISNHPSGLPVVLFCLSAMLFPVTLKAEKGREPITIDQITKELINSWWDSPKTYTNARTQCEEVEHVVEIHPTVGEKAFLAVCHVNRSHVEGFTTSLIVRPRYKEAREFINIDDGVLYGRDIDKVVDIDHDGISEIVIGNGHMSHGFYGGDRMVVSVKDWLPHKLFKRRVNGPVLIKIGFATVLTAAVVTWSSAWIGNPSLSGESQETD